MVVPTSLLPTRARVVNNNNNINQKQFLVVLSLLLFLVVSSTTAQNTTTDGGAIIMCGDGIVGNGQCADSTLCCSKFGYCGTTMDFCGNTTGAGEGGGNENSNSTLPCGDGIVGNGICADTTLCCSEYGYCGTTPEHCGAGIDTGAEEGGDGMESSSGVAVGQGTYYCRHAMSWFVIKSGMMVAIIVTIIIDP